MLKIPKNQIISLFTANINITCFQVNTRGQNSQKQRCVSKDLPAKQAKLNKCLFSLERNIVDDYSSVLSLCNCGKFEDFSKNGTVLLETIQKAKTELNNAANNTGYCMSRYCRNLFIIRKSFLLSSKRLRGSH